MDALKLPEGIVIHEPGDRFAPRLPILGLRALMQNRLTLIVDGVSMTVSLETA